MKKQILLSLGLIIAGFSSLSAAWNNYTETENLEELYLKNGQVETQSMEKSKKCDCLLLPNDPECIKYCKTHKIL